MDSYDFDEKLQEMFNKAFSNIERASWRSWLNIGSREEYEELSLKLSGLSSIEDKFNRIKTETTDSRNFTVDLDNFLKNYQDLGVPILSHTSGTTNSNL